MEKYFNKYKKYIENTFVVPKGYTKENFMKELRISEAELEAEINTQYELMSKSNIKSNIVLDNSEWEISNERKELVKITQNFIKYYFENETNKPKGLYIYGSFGIGKSLYCNHLANICSKSGLKVYILDFNKFGMECKDRLSNNTTTGIKIRIEELSEYDILIIDDIGNGKVSRWTRDDILLQILDSRMNSNKPTIYTSNLNLNQLELWMSDNKDPNDLINRKRVMERIKPFVKEINLKGKNRR